MSELPTFNFPWCFDLSSAPRGEYVETITQSAKGPVKKSTYRHVTIFLLGACGTVTPSKWLPLEERWEMFSKTETPIAWMPWPIAPKYPE